MQEPGVWPEAVRTESSRLREGEGVIQEAKALGPALPLSSWPEPQLSSSGKIRAIMPISQGMLGGQ